jgi:O-acetylhomoserine (thiol)-lyase
MSEQKKNYSVSTIAVQGTYEPDATGAGTIPLYQSTAYDLGDADRAAALFDLKEFGNIYTRLNNPTNSLFEEKAALLEGGVGALSTASGQAAVTLGIWNICTAGDHIISASTLYGGTHTLFAHTFKKLGIETTFVDPEASLEDLQKVIQSNTKVIYAESIGNPGLNVLDFEKFSALAKKAGVPLMVDNTFATPYLLKPFDHGADIVVYSATKYIGGHGNSMGGLIIDSGKFEWTEDKYPGLVNPDPSYHGIKYVESFGPLSYIVKARVQLLRDLGSTISPFNSFLLHTGLETLHLRMERHSENALALAEYLENHELVEWVSYPGLPSHPSYEKAKSYLAKGASGMLTFGVKGGKEAGRRFINNVELASLVANLGDTRTLVIHPASTTHSQLTEEEQIASGVSPDLIRVSVGIEAIEDIKADFDQALRAE